MAVRLRGPEKTTPRSQAPGREEHLMVGATGFEPATTSTPRRCATGLRYAPTCLAMESACGDYRSRLAAFGQAASPTLRPPATYVRRLRPRGAAVSWRRKSSNSRRSSLRPRIASSRSSFANGIPI